MGKLNIAHHKSYHPYRRDNIERVRQDEEEAAKKEAVEEGRMLLADSEARIDLLRQRAGLVQGKSRRKQDESEDTEPPQAGPSTLTTAGGHINLFEDLEQQSLPLVIRTSSKRSSEPTDKGVPLAPSEKDLKPWYSDKQPELDDDRKLRDLARKSVHDPLTSINSQLGSRPLNAANTSVNGRRSRAPPSRPRRSPSPRARAKTDPRPPEVTERMSRESTERQRAMELIRRKKREMAGSETPSTVHGGMDGGYRDVFNRREVEDAHRHRDRRWDGNDDRGTRRNSTRW